MRSSKMNGYIYNNKSSFMSAEKDFQAIIKSLFVDNLDKNFLKKLLVINTKDCIDRTDDPEITIKREVVEDGKFVDKEVKVKVSELTVADLRYNGYIRIESEIDLDEHEDAKAYIMISFDNYTPNASDPYYRDCVLYIDLIANNKYWDIGNYRIRPLKMAGFVDGVLCGSRLSGIGTLIFMGMNKIVMNDYFSGYCLMYHCTHGVDDALPVADE